MVSPWNTDTYHAGKVVVALSLSIVKFESCLHIIDIEGSLASSLCENRDHRWLVLLHM